MRTLNETANAAGAWVAFGVAVGLGWQLSGVVSSFVYGLCEGAIGTITEHMKE